MVTSLEEALNDMRKAVFLQHSNRMRKQNFFSSSSTTTTSSLPVSSSPWSSSSSSSSFSFSSSFFSSPWSFSSYRVARGDRCAGLEVGAASSDGNEEVFEVVGELLAQVSCHPRLLAPVDQLPHVARARVVLYVSLLPHHRHPAHIL
eukprot:768509-Hanusia_phi.AAC.3